VEEARPVLALHPVYLVTLDPLGDDDEELQAGVAQPLLHAREG